MDKALEAIRDAWEGRPAAGTASSGDDGPKLARDDDKARKLADKFVEANADTFAGYDNLSQELLVRMLEDARERGDEEGQWKTQAWLFHRFEPQNIGGTYEGKLRVSNGR
jgi:hypothetical protein